MEIDLSYEHKTACPRCRRKGQDRSGNNLHVYGQGKGAYCWSCEYTILSDEQKALKGLDDEDEYEEEEEVSTREAITPEENEQIKGYTGISGKGFRGIKDETNKFFGVRYQYDETTGEPIKEFVPTTRNGELVGYKTRIFPKDFTQPIGHVGKDVDLIGQFRFKTSTQTLLIVGGEIKQRAAYQMLVDEQKRRGKEQYEPTAVVSPTVGESGAYKQIQMQYDFCNQFKKIIVCMDSDKAGEEAAEKIAKVLPRGKVFIMKMRLKDADEYIKQGKQQDFISDFWAAKPWSPAGIYTADSLYDAALEHVALQRLAMPSFLPKLNNMLGGGIPKGGAIVLIAAASSIGKTTLLNQCLVEWIMDEEERFGVLSLEATAGDYATNLISYYTRTRYASIADRDTRVALMSSEETRKAAMELLTREDGTPRFILCDDRGERLEVMQQKVEEMIKSMGCTAILIDVTSDLLAGLTVAEQEVHMDWQKKLTKETGVTLINVVHIRKAPSGAQAGSRGAAVTDESIMGSSSLYKSASIIIGLQRDKMAEDDMTRNTTVVSCLKNRAGGTTGPAGELYYDMETHRLYDKDVWLEQNPMQF